MPDNVFADGYIRGAVLQPDRIGRKGLTQDFERGGIALNDPSQGRDVQDWRIRVDGTAIKIGPVDGAEVTYFIEAGVTEVSLAFDTNMRPTIGYMSSGACKLRYFDTLSLSEQTITIAGAKSPFLSLDDKRQTQNANSDILFFYIRANNLYFRQQRDRYQTERLLLTGVGANASIHRVGMNAKLRMEVTLKNTVLRPAMLVYGWQLTEPSDTANFNASVLVQAALAGVEPQDVLTAEIDVIASFILSVNEPQDVASFNGSITLPPINAVLSVIEPADTALFDLQTTFDDPFIDNVLLLLHGDGTSGSGAIIDSSLYMRRVTAAGQAQVSSAQSKFGGASLLFDGAGDYVTTAHSADWDFGSGDFTIECWVRFNALATVQIIGKRLAAAFAPFSLIYNAGTNRFEARFDQTTGNGIWDVELGGTQSITTGVWYHVATTRSGNTFRLFIDGTQVASGTLSGALATNTDAVFIGANSDGTASLNGYIDDLRVTKGVARYTANFTPPTAALPDPSLWQATTLLLHAERVNGNTSIIDSSRERFGFQAVGAAQHSTAQFRFGSSSLSFNGTNSLFASSEAPTGEFDLDTISASTNFTVEMFARWNSVASATRVLATHGNPGSGAADRGGWSVIEFNGQLWFVMGQTLDNTNPGWYTVWRTTAAPISAANTWYHVAFVINRGVPRIFVDGVEYAGQWVSGTNFGTSFIGMTVVRPAFGVRLGASQTDAGNPSPTSYFGGFIDELRVVRKAVYTDDFTPSVSPYSSDASSVAILEMDGANGSSSIVDSGPNNFSVSAIGGAVLSTSGAKSGSALLSLNGTSAYASIAHNAAFNFGAGNFTIECWVRPAANLSGASSQRVIAAKWGGASASSWMVDYVAGSLRGVFYSTTLVTSTISFACNLTAGTWYHVAFVREGGLLKLFLDGRLVVSSPFGLTMFGSTTATLIGYKGDGTGTEFWSGGIDGFRVSNVARYSAGFSVPSAPFADQAANDPSFNSVVLALRGEGPNGAAWVGNSANNVNGASSLAGCTVSTAQFNRGRASLAFTGTSSGALFGDSAAFSLGTSDFTAEMWVRFSAAPASSTYLCGQSPSSGANANSNFVIEKTAANRLRGVCYTGAGSLIGDVVGTTTVTTGVWYHVAYVRQGSTFTLYVNGVAEGAASSSASVIDSTAQFGVGRSGEFTSGFHNGNIDDFRLTVGVARYTANFTPPTELLEA